MMVGKGRYLFVTGLLFFFEGEENKNKEKNEIHQILIQFLQLFNL
jgi:hypothetical protein